MARTKPPSPPPHRVDPLNVYTIDQARTALGLAHTTLFREVQQGRLRASRRAGKYFFLGEWLLQWLRAGEVKHELLNAELGNEVA